MVPLHGRRVGEIDLWYIVQFPIGHGIKSSPPREEERGLNRSEGRSGTQLRNEMEM